MKIDKILFRVNNMDEQEIYGLLLSFLSACMKANKTNKPAPINHMFRERLGRRKDRACLNVVLNALANQIAKQAGVDPRREKGNLSTGRKTSKSSSSLVSVNLEETRTKHHIGESHYGANGELNKIGD